MRAPRLILASASPRRAEILSQMGLTFSVRAADVDESVRPGESATAHVRRLSRAKARAAARAVRGSFVIGADTVVVAGRRILGKPDSARSAATMLAALSGRSHQVLTGLTLLDTTTGRMRTRVECTRVFFRQLSKKEIASYVRSGEPLDKAGAYGIQGGAATFVERIEGNYLNVVGLPANALLRLLHPARREPRR